MTVNRIIHIIGFLGVSAIITIFIMDKLGNGSEFKDIHYKKDSKSRKGIILKRITLKDISGENLFITAGKAQEEGHLSKAESLFTIFIKKYPNEPEGYEGLGTTLTYDGKYDEARYYHEKALSLDSNRAGTYTSLGVVDAYQNKHVEAIGYYKKALKLDPNYALAHYGLACNYLFVDSFNLAIVHYQKVIELIPESIYAKRSKESIKKTIKYINE